jgi:hypothetical protein
MNGKKPASAVTRLYEEMCKLLEIRPNKILLLKLNQLSKYLLEIKQILLHPTVAT